MKSTDCLTDKIDQCGIAPYRNCMRIFPLLLIIFLSLPASGFAREAIHIVGSSTVFPFVAAAAEQFGRKGMFRTPIVEATGTGGGIKMFCSSVGLNTPDMVNASRPIKPAEIAECVKHGVADIVELKLGYDGIVFVTSVKGADFPLSRDILFKALAREVPVKGELVTNPYKHWREIDPKLPDTQIRVYGPPPTSGTRDAFSELVMVELCKNNPVFRTRYPQEEIRKLQCQQLREDGVYIEAGENDNLMVQKLSSDDVSLAIFGYSFLEQNGAVIKAHPVDGVMPEFAAITSGKYPVARSLYTYIKAAHQDEVAGLKEFAQSLTSDDAVGDDGYLVMKGLLPLPKTEHDAMKRISKEMKVMPTHPAEKK
jgi:phosphate transport system substrate-binding protein